ncbi:MAG: hypothetical protein Q9224_007090, partial [Gallowayella concinna]
MATAPPAWLQSYKAQSAIIPNFASQVRSDIDENPAAKTPPPDQTPPLKREDEEKKTPTQPDANTADPFTFPSMISLTLHNVGSLDKSYSTSTRESSPQKKTSLKPPLHEHPAYRSMT